MHFSAILLIIQLYLKGKLPKFNKKKKLNCCPFIKTNVFNNINKLRLNKKINIYISRI